MITQQELWDTLWYDRETGLFTWLRKANKSIVVGTVAGSLTNQGYVVIGLSGVRYLAHRLAFLWMEGSFPEMDIDHRNGLRSDNRWDNLRKVTKSTNQRNRHGAQANSQTGVLGVRRRGRRYTAQHAQVHLGTFDTVEEAAAAYAKEASTL